MIKLFYSNDAQYLARLLSRNLEQERPQGLAGVFHASRVIVPNLNVASFLQLEIAKASGICANVQFSFLDKFLSRLLPPGKNLVDRHLTHYLLVRYFLEHQASPASLPAEVAAYLGTAAGSDGNSDRWVYQLADRLARYYHEYDLARPRMLDAWRQGTLDLQRRDQGAQDAEKWQQKIWSALFGPKGMVEALSRSTGRTYSCFSDLPRLLRKEKPALPAQVHLFGFSYLSRTHNLVLGELAAACDLCIYTVNPCMEFWEDALTPAEASLLKQRYLERDKRTRREGDAPGSGEDGDDPYHLNDPSENDFLQRWGRPGRENIHGLNDMVSSDFYPGFIDPAARGDSLLRKLQQDILNRTIEKSEPLPGGYRVAGDGSLRILKCPEIRREIEIIANEIWDLVREDKVSGASGAERLRFNEIAVIIANAAEYDTYTTHIASVFHDIHEIPHTVSDLAPDSSRIVEAVETLLSLPVDPVTRSALLRLMTHPAFLNRFPEADAGEWIGWCRDLAIHHGESREDHRDTYIEKDLYNWDQGLRRLALGVFLEGERSGEEQAYRADGMEYLPRDVGQASTANAARFIALVRSLLADRAYARSSSLSLAEWAAFMKSLITTYLKPETPEDERVMSRCLGEIAGLARLDVQPGPMSYAMAREFASACLRSVILSRGSYLANGVVVTSFLPMRPVPFKAVFIAGMGEGCFPAREMRDPLDLRNARRLAGDVTPRERDQYNFLETLVSTRDCLRLTYVSRDSQTGESIEPSSIIKELQFILEHRYNLSPEDLRSLVVEHPLRRYDDRYFPGPGRETGALANYSRAAREEASSLKLVRDLRQVLEKSGLSADSGLPEQYARKQCGRLLYPVAVPARSPEAAPGEMIQVPLHAVRKFLECPLQGWASFHLGLREEETEDPRTSVDEVLASERLDAIAAEREAFMASRGAPDAWAACEQAYRALMDLNELKGIAPTGIFLDAEKRRRLADMRSWQDNYDLLQLPPDAGWRSVRFGTAGEHEQAGMVYPALRLDVASPGGQSLGVELSGSLDYLSPDLGRCLRLTNRDKEIVQKDFLYHFVSYMVLLASGQLAGGMLQAMVVSRKTTGKDRGVRQIDFRGSTPGAGEGVSRQGRLGDALRDPCLPPAGGSRGGASLGRRREGPSGDRRGPERGRVLEVLQLAVWACLSSGRLPCARGAGSSPHHRGTLWAVARPHASGMEALSADQESLTRI